MTNAYPAKRTALRYKTLQFNPNQTAREKLTTKCPALNPQTTTVTTKRTPQLEIDIPEQQNRDSTVALRIPAQQPVRPIISPSRARARERLDFEQSPGEVAL